MGIRLLNSNWVTVNTGEKRGEIIWDPQMKLFIVDFKMDSRIPITSRCKDCQETQPWVTIGHGDNHAVKTPAPSFVHSLSPWGYLLSAHSCSSSRPTEPFPAAMTWGPASTTAQLEPAAVTQSLPLTQQSGEHSFPARYPCKGKERPVSFIHLISSDIEDSTVQHRITAFFCLAHQLRNHKHLFYED